MRIGIVGAASALMLLASMVLSTATLTQTRVTVSGQVMGKQNTPKQFVSVSLDGPGQYVAITDDHGAFTIQNVTPGRYTVRVRQGDFVEEFIRDVGSQRIDLVVRW